MEGFFISGNHGDSPLGRPHGAPDACVGVDDAGNRQSGGRRLDADGSTAVGRHAADHKVRPLGQQAAGGGRQGLRQ